MIMGIGSATMMCETSCCSRCFDQSATSFHSGNMEATTRYQSECGCKATDICILCLNDVCDRHWLWANEFWSGKAHPVFVKCYDGAQAPTTDEKNTRKSIDSPTH